MSDFLAAVRQRLGRGRAERRAFQRFKAGIGAEVAIVLDGQRLSPTVSGVIEDISAGGLRLRAPQAFELGASLRVAFILPSDDQHAVCSVEVVACEPSGHEFIAHCKFVDLRRTTLGWQILDWAMSRQRAGESPNGSSTRHEPD